MVMVMLYRQMAQNIEVIYILENSTVTDNSCGPRKREVTVTQVTGRWDSCMVKESSNILRAKS